MVKKYEFKFGVSPSLAESTCKLVKVSVYLHEIFDVPAPKHVYIVCYTLFTSTSTFTICREKITNQFLKSFFFFICVLMPQQENFHCLSKFVAKVMPFVPFLHIIRMMKCIINQDAYILHKFSKFSCYLIRLSGFHHSSSLAESPIAWAS